MPAGHGLGRETSVTTAATSNPTKTQHRPRQVQAAVPQCAQSCLASRFGTFSCAQDDLSCLCTNYNSNGFALGELAFICLQEYCPDVTESDQTTAYNICSAISYHVTATHTILTIPSVETSTTGTTSTAFSTSTSTAWTSTAVVQPQDASTTSVSITEGYTPAATMSMAPSTNGTTGGGSSLTTAQAVGVSLGAICTVLLAIGIVFLLTYMRRRKFQRQVERQESYDFVDEEPLRSATFETGRFDGRRPFDECNPTSRVGRLAEKRVTHWPSPPPAESYYRNEKQVGGGLDAFYGSSPESHISNSSQRTASQLLPEKPERTLLPPSRSPCRGVRSTPATVLEEQHIPHSLRIIPPGLPGKSIKIKNYTRPQQSQYAPQCTRSPEPLKQPSLSLQIPQRPPRTDSIQVITGSLAAVKSKERSPKPTTSRPVTAIRIPPPPPPLRVRTESGEYPPRASVHSKMSKASRPESILNYYTGADGSSSNSLSSTTPIEDTRGIRAPPATITITRPIWGPQGSRNSTASDASRRTSFESIDPDEPTPPEEVERQLTPVRQSPVETSPITGLRYPKIPRPSNQAIPRSSVYNNSYRPSTGTPQLSKQLASSEGHTDEHARTLSGSTLAAKRRGDSAAQTLERGLHIKNSSSSRSPPVEEARARIQWRQSQRNESPLRGYGRNVRNEPGDWPLPASKQTAIARPSAPGPRHSNLWEPKLTPKREGDDLYLSVSVATPQYSTFNGKR